MCVKEEIVKCERDEINVEMLDDGADGSYKNRAADATRWGAKRRDRAAAVLDAEEVLEINKVLTWS